MGKLASLSYTEPLYVQLNVTDGANHLLASKDFQLSWGDSVSVSNDDSKLPYDLTVDFLKQTSVPSRMFKRADAPPGTNTVDWEDWVLSIAAGTTKWGSTDTDSSKLPFCNVGGWDNGDFWDWLDNVVSLGDAEHAAVSTC